MYDKSKKTWSQRLKITKSEKTTNSTTASITTLSSTAGAETTAANNANISQQQRNQTSALLYQATTPTMHMPTMQLQQLSDYHNGGGGGGYEYLSPSALSRSMKYAEPWIYGTVRGLPARPFHHYTHHQAAAAAANYAHPHAAAIFATHPLAGSNAESVAIVICSCSEYLNGTKRDVKKASVCKKCKGSRLPLATIGGTMRLPATSSGVMQASKLRGGASGAATMRVVSTSKKSRPTILDPQKDPYDLMRRTRLLSPEPGMNSNGGKVKASSSSASSRNRGKSASPVRGRSRKRGQLPPPKKFSINEEAASTQQLLHDCWLVDDSDYTLMSGSGCVTPTPSNCSRRSILRCNVNPYDLISIKSTQSTTSSRKTSNTSTSMTAATSSPSSSKPNRKLLQCSQNEFMPPNDDFNVEDAAFTEDAPPFSSGGGGNSGSKTTNRANVGGRASINRATQLSKSPKLPHRNEQRTNTNAAETNKPKIKETAESVGENVESAEEAAHNKNYTNVQAIAGQRISLGEHKSTKKSLIKQSEDGLCYESIIIGGDDEDNLAATRNERKVKDTQHHQVEGESGNYKNVEERQVQPKRPPRVKKQESNESGDNEQKAESFTSAARQNPFKSISQHHANDESAAEEVTLLTVTPTQNIKSILKRPTSKTSDSGEITPDDSTKNETTPTPSSANNNERRSSNTNNNNIAIVTTPTGTSQFYIPLPQSRKKVQFMVEDKVIHAENAAVNNTNNSSNNEQQNLANDDNVEDYGIEVENLEQAALLKTTTSYEYYNRKREQQKQYVHKAATTPTTATTTTNLNGQATLLAELQHDSDLVSSKNSALKAMDNRINNKTTTNINGANKNISTNNINNHFNKKGSNSNSNSDENEFDASAKILLTNTKSDIMHYEDVIPQQQQQQHRIVAGNNENCSSSNNCKIMSDSSMKLLLASSCHAGSQLSSSSPSSTSSSRAVAASNATSTPPSTPTSSSSLSASQSSASVTSSSPSQALLHVIPSDDGVDDNDYEYDENDDVLKTEHAAATTTTRITGDYDDDAKQHNLQAFVANDSSAPATQSRNPIRRSHSERHPPTSSSHHQYRVKNGNGSKEQRNNDNNNNSSSDNEKRNNSSSNRVDAILNFKDTMALRIKNSRNDTRDLFARNSTTTTTHRPREPPPPPPPTPSSPNSTSVEKKGTAAAIVAAAGCGARETAEFVTKESTTNAAVKFKENALSLSPTGQATTKATGTTTTGSAKYKVAANRLDNKHNQQQQHQQRSANEQQTECKTNAKNQRNLTNYDDGIGRDLGSVGGASCQEINRVNLLDNKDANAEAQQMALRQQQRQQHHGKYTAQEATTRATTTTTTTTTNKLEQQQHVNSLLSSSSSSPKQQQRTVLRVAPFNKTTSEVHRLKISHSDAAEIDDNNDTHSHTLTSPATAYSFRYNANGDACTQKKTSILINGDDCYSTMNLSCDDTSTPHYHSSVVVADYSSSLAKLSDNNAAGAIAAYDGLKVTTTLNTVTINVSSPRCAKNDLIYQHNKINTLLSRQTKMVGGGSGRAIIPIHGGNTTAEVSLQRSASSTSSTSTSSMTSISSSGSGGSIPKRGRTLIRLDYEKENPTLYQQKEEKTIELTEATESVGQTTTTALLSHEVELLKILRNPVEAVKRNLVPHVCGRSEMITKRDSEKESIRNKKMKDGGGVNLCADTKSNIERTPIQLIAAESPESLLLRTPTNKSQIQSERNSFISKLLEDPTLSQVADGLESETVAELIENSLKRLKESRNSIDISGTKDSDDMNRLINLTLQKIQEERHATTTNTAATTTPTHSNPNQLTVPTTTKDEDHHSNRGSISSANSFASANNYEMFDFDANESDCYQSCSSEITTPGDDDTSSAATRSKFYQMLVDATLMEIEMSTNLEEEDISEHHYESIRNNGDPIYEEINDVPPPLPLTAPPLNDAELEKKTARSIFEGASKYDILSYLVEAKERGVVREETFEYPINCSNPIIIEEESGDTLSDLGKRKQKKEFSSRSTILSDSMEDAQSTMSSLSPPPHNFLCGGSSLLQRSSKGASSDIERNDSGVGSETSKSSRSKYQSPQIVANNNGQLSKNSPIHLCEDCDGPVETQMADSGIIFAPLVCRKCGKKRVERKEIITEIVETEEKYGRDLQIILEEFCHPMLVAGLLTQEQLSAIFLNTEELLENNQTLAERMRDALDIALEQGDDDLLTVNIGKIFLDFTQMLHAFESYCVRQAGASLLLANLEKEKELLRIFLKVSQMENAVLRRMNLNSFLMVPVQRVTKYPLLLARLYKVTPAHLEGRDQLKQAQEKIELHLNHINQEAKDVPTKLWRRISSSSPNRRASCEIDMINIKLRKMAIDILEWNHDEVRFAMEGKLLYTQPTDSNWKKARTIKLTPVNALLVTNGKPSANYKAEKVMSDKLNFPKHTGIREASLLVVKEKCGRYTLIREPLYLDRCVVCSEADWDDYFEVQEISSKDTFIFKAEDSVRTKQWYTQLQYHAQGMGAWRKRRNALANIMINGMLARS